MQTLVVPTSPCVDDETLFALARGGLSGPELGVAESHLQGCADCRAVLAEAARTLDPGSRPVEDPAALTNIARYRIDSLIGAGASGVVYRGFDTRLRRRVALKLLHPAEHGGVQEPQRLLREAQAMARLSSPYVVAVYDTGLHEGLVYLVMEFVDGNTLTDWLKEAPRSLAAILRVFADAAGGLSAAHESGLVHRDFKPANVLVARDGRARVTDFGLARDSESWLAVRQPDDEASTELYAPTRGLVGTPAYMAPELFENRPATTASDQFAFAVALFVALFDLHPFKAGEGIELSELMARTRAGTIQRPPLGDARSERLFKAVTRGLVAEPTERYPSVEMLMTAVMRSAEPPRHRRWLAFVAASILLGGAGLVRLAATASPGGQVPPSPDPPRATLTANPPVAGGASVVSDADAEPRTDQSAPVSSASSGTRGAPGRRRPPKPNDVRYKDWLKDPF